MSKDRFDTKSHTIEKGRHSDQKREMELVMENSPDTQADQRVEKKLRELVHSWGLSRFSEEMAWQWLLKSLSTEDNNNDAGDTFERVRKWILLQVNQQRRPEGVLRWQIGCPELIPALRSCPVWDCEQFPWVKQLEDAFPVIKAELLALKGQHGFQPYRAPTWASDIHVRCLICQ